jgi:hypothetical protein
MKVNERQRKFSMLGAGAQKKSQPRENPKPKSVRAIRQNSPESVVGKGFQWGATILS